MFNILYINKYNILFEIGTAFENGAVIYSAVVKVNQVEVNINTPSIII